MKILQIVEHAGKLPCRMALALPSRSKCALLTVAMAWGFATQITAQQRIGATIERRAPFADERLNADIEAILVHMDAVRSDSAIAVIARALGRLAPHEEEARYYLMTYRAEVLYYDGLFNEGLQDLDVAEGIAHRISDSTLVANVLNLQGLLWENVRDDERSAQLFEQALRWFPAKPTARYPLTERHHIHANLGACLTRIGDRPRAREHLLLSLQLAEEAGIGRAVAVALFALGELDLAMNRADSALIHFDRSRSVAQAHKEADVALDAEGGRCRALVALGRSLEAQRALERTEASLHLQTSAIGLAARRNFFQLSTHLYTRLGRTSSALRSMQHRTAIDSVITKRNLEQALATQANLLTADNEVALQRSASERAREALASERDLRWSLTAIGILVLLAITGLALLNASRLQQVRRVAEKEARLAQQELLIAELRVREEVSRDLHDDLGVGLSALKLRSEMALRVEKDPTKREQLSSLARSAGELIGSMRQIIWTMNSDQGTISDLVAYASNYVRSYCEENGLTPEVVLDADWPDLQLTSEQRRNIFLFVKEALHNVVKHADARRVRLVIHANGDRMALVVEDDGVGLPKGSDQSVGNGLRNMNKRIVALGGTLEQGTPPSSKGTMIRAEVPLPNKGSIAGRRTTQHLRTE
jgi:signal transduction histidine kinase